METRLGIRKLKRLFPVMVEVEYYKFPEDLQKKEKNSFNLRVSIKQE
jgi:hypothetical protein